VTFLWETRHCQWHICPKRANDSGTLLKNVNSTDVFDHYKFASPVTLFISQTNQISHRHLSYKQIKYPKFSFFQMIPDLNFDPSDEGNYTAEEPSGSSFFMKKNTLWKNRAAVAFLRKYFQIMIKAIPIQIMFKIQFLNFN
jgi:hypothetical protein